MKLFRRQHVSALELDSLKAIVPGEASRFNWPILTSLVLVTLVDEVIAPIPLVPPVFQLWLERLLLIDTCSFLPPMIELIWYLLGVGDWWFDSEPAIDPTVD